MLFDDYKSCIALAKAPRMNPRTKYISLKYNHFRSFVSGKNTRVNIDYVRTNENVADIFTKPLPGSAFNHLRENVCGW